jgi:hypothetical protein
MKEGDIVRILDKNRRLCVLINVTKADLRKGLNAHKTGLHLFRGYWYGINPLSHKSYGKIEGHVDDYLLKKLGRMKYHKQAKYLNI